MGHAMNSAETNQLVAAIKAHIAKGDRATEKAEQHYIAAGQHLKALKAAHTGPWADWESLLKTRIGIGKSRATELMQIADGRTTVEQIRAAGAERKREHDERKKISPLRNGESGETIKTTGNFRAGNGNVEWGTPSMYVDLARAVLGEIDLDPASSDKAQKIVQATQYFTVLDNGLTKPWHGRVFCNPPYSHVADFVEKLITERNAGNVTAAIILVHDSTSAGWYHRLLNHADAMCVHEGRIHFIDAHGHKCDSPPYGSTFFYFGKDTATFAQHFANVGCCRWRPRGATLKGLRSKTHRRRGRRPMVMLKRGTARDDGDGLGDDGGLRDDGGDRDRPCS
jgi:phage N-6-adenine-methyltransferase